MARKSNQPAAEEQLGFEQASELGPEPAPDRRHERYLGRLETRQALRDSQRRRIRSQAILEDEDVMVDEVPIARDPVQKAEDDVVENILNNTPLESDMVTSVIIKRALARLAGTSELQDPKVLERYQTYSLRLARAAGNEACKQTTSDDKPDTAMLILRKGGGRKGGRPRMY